jgi:arylsulfatase A-like enzyme
MARTVKRPNILVIMGDDIGISNISAYSRGIMGYHTPNIDRIAREGAMLVDYYGEQSCTAGRAAFITGQLPVRTGLTKVGIPGATLGLQPEDPTLAELLKPLGYACGQFGKNHLGDRNEFLPTVHGFDEFFGNLYHLNAEEEPENPDYPKDPEFRRRSGPRGVLVCKASERDDNTEDIRFGRVGKQTIRDSGPLTVKRMETIDEEILSSAMSFIQRQHGRGQPFFTWFNTTRMHVYTHLKRESEGLSGQGTYNDAMVEHDHHVGQLLGLLDSLGIADDTIVIYTTDNGPHFNEWPDGAITPFRSEKDTNWEGAIRVPCVVRWPGHIEPGSVLNQIVSAQDWVPTLMAAAGDVDIQSALEKGQRLGDKLCKVHLDGFNVLPYLTGKEAKSPRTAFPCFDDDGEIVSLRFGDWKLVYREQRAHYFDVWAEPLVKLRIPKLFNLRRDPYERADTDSNNYRHWWIRHAFMLFVANEYVEELLKSFVDFPPRQKPASFNLDQVVRDMKAHRAKLTA